MCLFVILKIIFLKNYTVFKDVLFKDILAAYLFCRQEILEVEVIIFSTWYLL